MIVFFDLETSGTDPLKDRIVEIAAIKVDTYGNVLDELYYKINPEILILKEASLVHGIYNNDVYDCPTIYDVRDHIFDFFDNCILGGYNNNAFDNPLLVNELKRVGKDLTIRETIDVYQLWMRREKTKKLSDAYLRFCGKEMVNAHSALDDITQTIEIYKAQKKLYNLTDRDVIEYTRPQKKIDNGIINFGKHSGKHMSEVPDEYLQWCWEKMDDKEVVMTIAEYFKNRKTP